MPLLDADFTVRQMTQDDFNQVKQVIDLSFPIFYRFFAAHSLQEEGQVLVSERAGRVAGFAKLIDFDIGGKNYGCILWIAVYPSFRRKGIAASLTNSATQRLKHEGTAAVFASTQRRNVAALSVLRLQGFRRMSFFGLWQVFGWRVFKFYWDIWFAPGEIVLMHD
jgi:ribosomal protein S18 acetylase RimI-like enzyme